MPFEMLKDSFEDSEGFLWIPKDSLRIFGSENV